MHAIRKLRLELAAAEARAASFEASLRDLRVHIASDKFAGESADGESKTWISTRDVDARILSILHDAQIAADEAETEITAAA